LAGVSGYATPVRARIHRPLGRWLGAPALYLLRLPHLEAHLLRLPHLEAHSFRL